MAHPTYVRLLRNLLRSQQVDADAVLRQAGLDWSVLSKDPQGIRYDTVHRLVQASLAATQRPWFGLELGSVADPSTHGQVSTAILASPDVRRALSTFARYASLRTNYFVWSFAPEPGGAALHVRECIDLGASRDYVYDLLFGVHLKILDAVIGHAADSLVVDVPRERPAWEQEYMKRCAGKIRFGAAALSFHLPHTLLDLPCATADSRVYDAASRACEAMLGAAQHASSAQKVRAILLTAANSYPTLIELAAQLHLTPQTLMRHLKREGTSYQALMDEVRSAGALRLLRDSTLTVEQIATQLGYADTSNFSRTVRRWFGATPLEIRGGQVGTALPTLPMA